MNIWPWTSPAVLFATLPCAWLCFFGNDLVDRLATTFTLPFLRDGYQRLHMSTILVGIGYPLLIGPVWLHTHDGAARLKSILVVMPRFAQSRSVRQRKMNRLNDASARRYHCFVMVMARATVLTREPSRQILGLLLFGLFLALMLFIFLAPDVVLSLMVTLTLAKVRQNEQREEQDEAI